MLTCSLFLFFFKALYPSIDPDLALKAMAQAFLEDTLLELKTKKALSHMADFVLNNAFVEYKNKAYRVVKGIPTGGSVSRQIADFFLHWIFLHIH